MPSGREYGKRITDEMIKIDGGRNFVLHFGLAGNPNCGKTTLFNQLTGSNAHVGNWPGVTVDRKEGLYKGNTSLEINVIDLPGIYSLSPYTPEEKIARNFIIEHTPDLIIDIVDATNIERNLYLTTQLLEADCPIVIGLNMMDLAEKEGDQIDVQGLSDILGVPVVPISAVKGTGTEELMKAAVEAVQKGRNGKSVLVKSKIGRELKQAITILENADIRHPVFHAVRLLEGDPMTMEDPVVNCFEQEILPLRESCLKEDAYGDIEAMIADLRYCFITEQCVPLIIKKRQRGELSPSEKIDRLLTHKYLGIPIFFLFMFIVFHFTFSQSFLGIDGIPSPGVFFQELAKLAVDWISNMANITLAVASAPDWAYGLVVDGMIGGVGAVLSFVPQILCLFLFLSILEDSGYMARAAFIMDRLLRNFGLSGRAFLPLLMGFGCSVPAIMASRTLENETDRRITVMIIPYMSCGAKLPIYAMFAAALFQQNSDVVIFGMYFIGIIVAIVAAIALKSTILKADPAPFILELPAYHLPGLKTLSILLWEKLKDYIVRAGTLILASTIVIWFLSNFNFSLQMVEANSSGSILGVLGSVLVPLFRPLGFVSGNDGWRAIVAILTGLIAKEAVVSTMGVLYTSAGGDVLSSEAAREALLVTVAAAFTPLAALSFMAFNLLCVPCIAAVSAMRAEMKSAKWTCIAISFWIFTAWIVSFIIFQIGGLLGF